MADVAVRGSRERIEDLLDRASFTLLVMGVAVVPLWFRPQVANVFVHPKFQLLRALVAMGSLTAVAAFALRRQRLELSRSDVAVLLFVVLNALAYVYSIDRQTSLFGEPLQRAGLVTVFALAGVYWIARLTVRTEARLRMVMIAASATASVVAIYGVLQLTGLDPVWAGIPGDRAFSSIGQPNWLAAYLVMTVPVTAALTSTVDSRAGRLLATGSLTLQAIVLIATRSRSGYLGLLVVVVVGGLMAVRQTSADRRRPAKALMIAVGVVALGGVLFVGLGRTNPSIAPSAIAARATSAVDVGGFDAQRYVSLWKVGASMTVDRPLIGYGPDTYAIAFPAYRDRVLAPIYSEHFAQYRPESPHNVYLAVSAGAGVPATLAYIAAVTFALHAMTLHIGSAPPRSGILRVGIAAALVGHIVTDVFMTLDLSGSCLFWALIGGGVTHTGLVPARASATSWRSAHPSRRGG